MFSFGRTISLSLDKLCYIISLINLLCTFLTKEHLNIVCCLVRYFVLRPQCIWLVFFSEEHAVSFDCFQFLPTLLFR